MRHLRPMQTFAIRPTAHAALVVVALAASPLVAGFPRPQGFVTDAASVLTDAVKAEAESLIREAERKTTAEIAVATVPSLDGLSVEEYATRLFAEWGVGKKAVDNGVLILVAPVERAMRIEVGYGLEPILPDALAGDIIRNDALPAFRNGDYPGGVLASVRRVAALVEARHVVTAEERRRLQAAAESRPPPYFAIPFLGMFIAVGGFAVGIGLRTRTVFPLLFGSLFGGAPLLMSFIPGLTAAPLILGPLALAMVVLGYRKGGSGMWNQIATASAAAASAPGRGSWTMGKSPSSSSRSSSSRLSGGSFGGGRSGGGGASGRW